MFLYKISFPDHLTTKCYIGITTQKISRRFNQHCNHKTSLISKAIKKYGRDNAKIDVLLTACDIKSLYEAEEKAIVKFNSITPHGYNISVGGESHSRGVSQSKETKNKRALKLTGQKRTPEQKERMSVAAKNITDEKRIKLSVAKTGKKHSEETRVKLSLARKNISEETRRKMSESAKARACSKDIEIKMKDKRFTGKKHSDESKEKMRNAAIGRVYSEETIINMTVASNRSKKIGSENKKSKRYVCISPDGRIYHVHGLTQFCKEHKISVSSMCNVANGKEHTHKKWICKHE